jgi:hypothetical protein
MLTLSAFELNESPGGKLVELKTTGATAVIGLKTKKVGGVVIAVSNVNE